MKELKKLIEVKTLVTLPMTYALIFILVKNVDVSQPILALFSMSYGATMTYFFQKKPPVVKEEV